MPLTLIVFATFLPVAAAALVVVLTRWGTQWGSTPEEQAEPLPGDDYLAGGPPTRVRMTRAISIDTSPKTVWPWLAQLGRGAGFYSIDRLDNGGRMSARHIVSWVPPPRLGDASAIGYLRHVVPGSQLTWWVPGVHFLGAFARLATDIRLRPQGAGSRLVIRMSADAAGAMARPSLWMFRLIDSIMACAQLSNLKKRVEAWGGREADPEHPETGARDQFQYYEVIHASGEKAGVPGKEDAARWHRAAAAAGLIDANGRT
jgi:hypothetical protein